MLRYFAISTLALGGLGAATTTPGTDTLAAIGYNDNLQPSGARSTAGLTVALEVVRGQWHVMGPDRPAGQVLAFGEVGKTPSIPGPLLRVPLGTMVRASVTNRHDVTLVVRGLSSRRNPVMDSLVIPAGETREARFTADVRRLAAERMATELGTDPAPELAAEAPTAAEDAKGRNLADHLAESARFAVVGGALRGEDLAALALRMTQAFDVRLRNDLTDEAQAAVDTVNG